jgi:hypothetical protein
LFRRLRAFGFRDRGAVAFEFALICFPMLLLASGIFGVGVVMVEYMQLHFTVENAANVGLGDGDAAGWAQTQLPQATFIAQSVLCSGPVTGKQVQGTWPTTLGVLDAVTLTLSASATACAQKQP